MSILYSTNPIFPSRVNASTKFLILVHFFFQSQGWMYERRGDAIFTQLANISRRCATGRRFRTDIICEKRKTGLLPRKRHSSRKDYDEKNTLRYLPHAGGFFTVYTRFLKISQMKNLRFNLFEIYTRCKNSVKILY